MGKVHAVYPHDVVFAKDRGGENAQALRLEFDLVRESHHRGENVFDAPTR
eukprot:CAMPEP_0202063990 /NCGR_PEP_ID=MMETSP0963-20130614/47914_1 /ASSEMBLY_ACC=CAM_ASM_000494 /TAXON_ID=4773 /ORGANISM="Schizochytrium aggregatum, Strain ATCC28209" /LENGTH=49 /DNA_ID= /DNA_START= /DNA_END= /DNA_ORIENTATION=